MNHHDQGDYHLLEDPSHWHRLHNMAPHAGEEMPIPKGDRWLIGFAAGAVLIYLLGQSFGLGRR